MKRGRNPYKLQGDDEIFEISPPDERLYIIYSCSALKLHVVHGVNLHNLCSTGCNVAYHELIVERKFHELCEEFLEGTLSERVYDDYRNNIGI